MINNVKDYRQLIIGMVYISVHMFFGFYDFHDTFKQMSLVNPIVREAGMSTVFKHKLTKAN